MARHAFELTLKIAVVIGLTEALVMIGFYFHPLHSASIEILIDVAVLMGGSSPVIYFWVVRPYVLEREAAERSLRESEARFRAFVEHSPSSISIKDLQLRYVVFGKGARPSLKNLDPSDVIGKTAHDVFPKDLADAFIAHDREVLERKQKSVREHTSVAAGEQRSYRALKFPILDDGGAVIAIGTITEDITEHKQAEQAVRDAEARLRALIDNWPGGVHMKDLQGRYLLVNKTFVEMAGISPDEIVGKTVFEVFPSELAQVADTLDHEVIARHEPMQGEQKISMPGRGQRHLAIYKFPVLDVHGSLVAVGGIATDVTELKEAEESLWQAQKVESLAALAGGIAHNLNNMLLPIMGLTEMTMSDMPEGSQHRRRLEKVLEASERAKNLVEQILLFSRKAIPQKTALRLGSAITEAVDLLRATLPSSMEIHLDIGDEDVVVLADSSQIHAVLMNLGSNAAHAMEGRTGNFRISLSRAGSPSLLHNAFSNVDPSKDYALIRVKDDGIGMDERTMSRIFDPFFTTKEVGKGAGMGMSIVHGVVSQHGGGVRVSSRPGKGTTFEIYLPVADNNEEKDKST